MIVRTRKGHARCTVCGKQAPPGRWLRLCAEGHPIVCACGRRFTTALHRGAHVAKARCYDQPKEKA